MIPYVAVPYFGSLSYFGTTGQGLGDWTKIYLCNGSNGTPDLRGRTLVGATTGFSGPAFNPAVDPAIPGNPTYSLLTTQGANTITLSPAQMPTHTHIPSTVTIPPHRHDIFGITGGDTSDNNNTIRFAGGDKNNDETSFYFTNTEACQTTSLTGTLTIGSAGSSEAHSNIQPSIACYYIIYIP
jgi:microcystin-dependent protein